MNLFRIETMLFCPQISQIGADVHSKTGKRFALSIICVIRVICGCMFSSAGDRGK